MTTTALIGTTKGLCVLTGERGGTFAERGPLFPGENVDEAPVAFPEGAGASVARIWQLARRDRQARRRLRRRRAPRPVPQQRRRAKLPARGGAVEPPAPGAVAPRRRRPVPAHDPGRSPGPRRPDGGDLHR